MIIVHGGVSPQSSKKVYSLLGKVYPVSGMVYPQGVNHRQNTVSHLSGAVNHFSSEAVQVKDDTEPRGYHRGRWCANLDADRDLFRDISLSDGRAMARSLSIGEAGQG